MPRESDSEKKVKTGKKAAKKPSPKKPASKIERDDGFPIIGVGASAGGLEAFEGFFSRMPQKCNMAFVLIQHLDFHLKGYDI